ncbi:TetR/AcrR family transcriptional regulator [Saccharopolyspora sp. NPDC002376]
MSRKRVQLRREEILGATVDQIDAVGTGALRIADVAKRLDVSPALIIYHFETRDKLIIEALEHAAELDLLKLRRLVSAPGSHTQRLMRVIKWYTPTGRARGWKLWVDGWAYALRDKAGAAVVNDLDLQWKQTLASVIAAGAEAGEFEVEDSSAAATRIQAFLDGLAVQRVVHRRAIGRVSMEAWVASTVAYELGVDITTVSA